MSALIPYYTVSATLKCPACSKPLETELVGDTDPCFMRLRCKCGYDRTYRDCNWRGSDITQEFLDRMYQQETNPKGRHSLNK